MAEPLFHDYVQPEAHPAQDVVSQWLPRGWDEPVDDEPVDGVEAEVIELQPGARWLPLHSAQSAEVPLTIEYRRPGAIRRLAFLPRRPARWRSRYLWEHRRELMAAAVAVVALAAIPVLGSKSDLFSTSRSQPHIPAAVAPVHAAGHAAGRVAPAGHTAKRGRAGHAAAPRAAAPGSGHTTSSLSSGGPSSSRPQSSHSSTGPGGAGGGSGPGTASSGPGGGGSGSGSAPSSGGSAQSGGGPSASGGSGGGSAPSPGADSGGSTSGGSGGSTGGGGSGSSSPLTPVTSAVSGVQSTVTGVVSHPPSL